MSGSTSEKTQTKIVSQIRFPRKQILKWRCNVYQGVLLELTSVKGEKEALPAEGEIGP